MKKRIVSLLLAFALMLTLVPIHALALGGVIYVTLKSGLPGVEDVELKSYTYGLMVYSDENFVNGKFIQSKLGDVLYTRYRTSDVPESFGRTDLLCWKYTFVEQEYTTIVHPGEVISDIGHGGHFTLEAIWDGLEPSSYAFSSPETVTVTENTKITYIPFTLSKLTLGTADRLMLQLIPGEFSDGENTIHYEYHDGAVFSEVGVTEPCAIRISEDEWAGAKAGRYTANLEYEVIFDIGGRSVRTIRGSVPMTLQVGHDITVSGNFSNLGTASASAAMAREGETVTLTATPANASLGLRSWLVESGGVTVNADNTFVMGNEDVSIRAQFDNLYVAIFRYCNEALQYVARVFEGDTPVYAGETPTKPSTERYDYFFTGWDPPLGPIEQTMCFTAQFREEYKYFVTFAANGGTGTMDTDTFYASEGAYTLPPCDFTAPDGYMFKDWTVTWESTGGATNSTTCMAGRTLTGLTTDLTLSANWIRLSVNVSPANAGKAVYANGIFQATANKGYTFDHWEYGNDEYGAVPVGTVWPTDNSYQPDEVNYKIYTAVFTANEYALTIADGIEHGLVEHYSGTPATGKTIKLTVTPDEGWRLDTLFYTPKGGLPVQITATDSKGRYTFTMPAEDVTVTATFKEDAKPEFKSRQIVLSGQIGMYFFMTIPEEFVNGSYMEFDIGGKKSTVKTTAGLKQQDGRYRFLCGINAVQMADTLTATFHYTTGETEETVTYSTTVEEYLDILITNTSNNPVYAAAAESAKALNDYGYYSQSAVDLGTAHTRMRKAYKPVSDLITTLEGHGITKTFGSGVTSVFYSLSLTSETQINLYFVTDDLVLTKENTTVTASDGTTFDWTIKKVGERYRVQISGVNAVELGDTFTVTIDGGTTVTASALSYVQQALSPNSTVSNEVKHTAAALYSFHVEAYKYNHK